MRFFFSSRRRHTRYWRDWSSDVCSSDLPRSGPSAPPARRSPPPGDVLERPLCRVPPRARERWGAEGSFRQAAEDAGTTCSPDRKSTRLNSSHANISYAVFCLKKKKTTHYLTC